MKFGHPNRVKRGAVSSIACMYCRKTVECGSCISFWSHSIQSLILCNWTPRYHWRQRKVPRYHWRQRKVPRYHWRQRKVPRYHWRQRKVPRYHWRQRKVPRYHWRQRKVPCYHWRQRKGIMFLIFYNNELKMDLDLPFPHQSHTCVKGMTTCS